MTIAIIGAGVAGLSCAVALISAGHEARLFDKGRGPGGRLSTRRAETPFGQARFDHGAQYFSARSEAFREAVAAWAAAGAVSRWDGRVMAQQDDGHWYDKPSDGPRWVGSPSMNAIVKHMSKALRVDWQRRATTLQKGEDGWRIDFEDASHDGPFTHVICAVPAEQVSDLLTPHAPAFADAASAIISTPCWTVMAAFNDAVDAGWDGALPVSSPLSWVCCNSAKPERDGPEAWVLHASAEWSMAHLEDTPDTVIEALVAAFVAVTGGPVPDFTSAHRWRYAFPGVQSAPAQSLFDSTLGIGACGDWLVAPNIEGAWTSGVHLARKLISQA